MSRAFTDVRKRLLPDIARSRYADAKASFDRKEFPQAEQQFRNLLALLDDGDMGGRLGDLRVLVQGFLDLSVASSPPPPPPSVEPPRPAEPPVPPPSPTRAAVMATAARTPSSGFVSRHDARQDFQRRRPGITAPVAVKQELPRVPSTLVGQDPRPRSARDDHRRAGTCDRTRPSGRRSIRSTTRSCWWRPRLEVQAGHGQRPAGEVQEDHPGRGNPLSCAARR